MTKAQVRTAVAQLLDDPSNVRWSTANLDILIGMVMDDLVGTLLESAPYAVSQLDTITSLTAPGYVNVASGGDLSKRFFRLQSVTRDGRQYSEAKPRELVLEAGAVKTAPDYTFCFFGDQLHLFPYDTATDVEVRYSYRPTNFNSIATDGTAVEWPDGHEICPILRAVVFGMNKGAAEDASPIYTLYKESFSNLVSAIKRRAPGPSVMYVTDTSYGWGSIS